MFRIGIVGADSSHAEAFSTLINLPQANGEFLFPDCRVTAIYGLETLKAGAIAEKCRIELVADSLEELYDRIDGVIIVLRHGGLHKEYAMPFIERGIATWIDKPFTLLEQDALEIIEAAKRNGCLLTGGSTCRFAPEIAKARAEIKLGDSIGQLKAAYLSFLGDFNNSYGGAVFYGSHLIEIALELFGDKVLKVSAIRSEKALTAVLSYDSFEVTLSLTVGITGSPMLLLGDKGCYYKEVDISKVYSFGLQAFIEMLRTRRLPMALESLVMPVKLFSKIEEAADLKEAISV